MEFRDKNILVVGMARSGISAAKLLKQKGANVAVNDIKTADELPDAIAALKDSGIEFRLGSKPVISDDLDMIIVSPGVPADLAPFNEARSLGIPVIGEIELGYTFAESNIITAITGTNGKTTTTALMGEIYKKAGFNAHVAGNIGIPVCEFALSAAPGDDIVLEISSFQLETINRFRPRISCILNITPDHLDRHKGLEGYINAKMRIFENQRDNDVLVLNFDNVMTRNVAAGAKCKVLFFSRQNAVDKGVCIKDGKIIFTDEDGLETVIGRPEEIRLPGKHNLENALAAVAMACARGVDPGVIRHTLAVFEGVEHRIEYVETINGIRFINDSKGTNTDATICAIESMELPTVIILGGYDKGADFDELIEKFTPNIKGAVVLGKTAGKITDSLNKAGFGNFKLAKTFDSAVRTAFEMSKPGYNVLLSPACASYDMFNNFEERGIVFKQIVRSIKEEYR